MIENLNAVHAFLDVCVLDKDFHFYLKYSNLLNSFLKNNIKNKNEISKRKIKNIAITLINFEFFWTSEILK